MIPKPYNIQLIVKVDYNSPDQEYLVNSARLSIPVDVETKYGIQLVYDSSYQINSFLDYVLKKTIDKYKKDLEEEATRKEQEDTLTVTLVPAPTTDIPEVMSPSEIPNFNNNPYDIKL